MKKKKGKGILKLSLVFNQRTNFEYYLFTFWRGFGGGGGGEGQDLCNCILPQLYLTYIAIYFPLKMASILDWLFVPFVKREKICLYFSPISTDVLSDLTVRRNKKGTNVLVPRLSRPCPAAITCDNQVATYVILFLKSVLVLSIYALIHVSSGWNARFDINGGFPSTKSECYWNTKRFFFNTREVSVQANLFNL